MHVSIQFTYVTFVKFKSFANWKSANNKRVERFSFVNFGTNVCH